MDEHEWYVEFLSLGLVIPRTEQNSPKVKDLLDAGLIKAEQIEDCVSGNPIWVCDGLSDAAKNALYQKRAAEANAQVQAQMRALVKPLLNLSGPPELVKVSEKIKADLEKAIKDIRLF
jgi:hypothetical protein